jgi:hypothetical protein
MPLLYDSVLDYDALHMELTFIDFTLNASQATLLCRTANPAAAMMTTTYRLVVAGIFLCLSVIYAAQIRHSPATLEQHLTGILCILTFLYADPLCVLRAFAPSRAAEVLGCLFADLYRAYAVFYTAALFRYFTRPAAESAAAALSAPLLVAFLFFVVSAAQNTHLSAASTHTLHTAPALPNRFSAAHFLLYTALWPLFAVAVYVAKRDDVNNSSVRFYNYFVVSIAYFSVLYIHVFLCAFTSLFEARAMADALPFALAALYGAVMAALHQHSTGVSSAQHLAGNENSDRSESSNTLGIGSDTDEAEHREAAANGTSSDGP